jgi:simple sugar transport system permease protein
MGALANPELWSSTITLSIPIAFAALGGVISERAGIINIALEGKMLVGAFVAVAVDAATGSVWIGVLAAILAGGLAGALHAWASVYLRANHFIVGMAINILAAGTTGFLFNSIYGPTGTPGNTASLPTLHIPLVEKIPFVGQIVSGHQVLVYVFFLCIILVQFALFRTPLGLRLRSVGEFPKAADAAGVRVLLVKFGAVVAAGMLAALGGADISIGILNRFNPDMVAGRGYIALAAMIFGAWRPWRSFGASLLFGFATALSFQLQGVSNLSRNILLMLPYAMTILALAGFVGKTIPPAADGELYDPGR